MGNQGLLCLFRFGISGLLALDGCFADPRRLIAHQESSIHPLFPLRKKPPLSSFPETLRVEKY